MNIKQDHSRLRTLRLTAGLTQEQLGDKAGVSKTMVSCVERGVANFSAPSRRRIEDALGLEPGELLIEKPEGTSTASR